MKNTANTDKRNRKPQQESQKQGILAGRNAVSEAIKSGRPIEKIIAADGIDGSGRSLVAKAKDAGIKVEFADRKQLDKLYSGAHQGLVAKVAAHKYSTVDDIFEAAVSAEEPPFVIILDDIEDPRNLGAIMRTAECAGVHGIIIGKDRAVGLTETVAKASAGAIEYMKVAKVTNIARTIEELKERGLWIAACDMDGDDYNKTDLKGALAIVIGNEGKGISRLVKEKCDFTVAIPMKGHISSLNAGSAAAILMYEVLRQRQE